MAFTKLKGTLSSSPTLTFCRWESQGIKWLAQSRNSQEQKQVLCCSPVLPVLDTTLTRSGFFTCSWRSNSWLEMAPSHRMWIFHTPLPFLFLQDHGLVRCLKYILSSDLLTVGYRWVTERVILKRWPDVELSSVGGQNPPITEGWSKNH